MSISFNFKKEKVVKETEEKYQFPVLTQLPKKDGKKPVAKFKLNKELLQILHIDGKDCMISVGKKDNGEIVIVNTTGIDTPHQSHVNIDGTINNGFLMKVLNNSFNTSPDFTYEYKTIYENEEDLHMAVIKSIIVPELNAENVKFEDDLPEVIEIIDEEDNQDGEDEQSEDLDEESVASELEEMNLSGVVGESNVHPEIF